MSSAKNVILSIKYGGHDTAAALMADGKLVAACEQERYSLDKHTRQFPNEAIADCLHIAGVTIDQVDELAFVNDIYYFIREMYLRPAMENDARIGFLLNDIEIIRNHYHMEDLLRKETGFTGPITYHRHHLCHLASAYYPSGFKDALVVSFDGMGERETAMIAAGRSGALEILHQKNYYPDSLGLLYSALTYYLGWQHHCDEGIIMGLASFGDAQAQVPGQDFTYYDLFSDILVPDGDYGFTVNRKWADYYEVRDKWVSDKFIETLGPKRDYEDPITQHHKDIAAALQKRLEDVVLAMLRRAKEQTGLTRLCVAGGVGLNCSLNGKILASGIFEEIFVQPAAGDSGTTIGGCFLAHQKRGNQLTPKRMHNFYAGSRFSPEEVKEVVDASGLPFSKPEDIYALVAERLEQGRIVGWFQGAAEFGPRALGNRSILCRPYPDAMKDHINARVKFREEFRPFAPAVMAEHAQEYFGLDQESPHMLMAVQVRPDKRDVIPAVVHVDGSCRAQTVKPENNRRFYELIKAFKQRTGVPVVLNTSFNVKGQPIVNTPQQAIDSFLSTNIDCLVVGDFFTEK